MMRSESALNMILHKSTKPSLLSDLHMVMTKAPPRVLVEKAPRSKLVQTLPDLMTKLHPYPLNPQAVDEFPKADINSWKRIRHTSMGDEKLIELMRSGGSQKRQRSDINLNRDNHMYHSQHSRNSSFDEDLRNQVIKLKIENKRLNNQILKDQIRVPQRQNKQTQCRISSPRVRSRCNTIVENSDSQTEKVKILTLEHQLVKKEQQIMRLEKENVVLRLGNSHLGTQVSLMQSEIQIKSSELDEESKQVHSLLRTSSQENELLKKQIGILQKEVSSKDSGRKKLESEKIQLQVSIKELRDEVKGYKNRQFHHIFVQTEGDQTNELDQLKVSHEQLQKSCLDVNEQNEHLRSQIARLNELLKETLEQHSLEIEILSAKQNQEIQRLKQSQREDTDQLNNSLSSKTKELNLLKKQMQLFKTENQTLKIRIQQLQQQLEKEVKEFTSSIISCQEKHRNDLEKFKGVVDRQSNQSEITHELNSLKALYLQQSILLESLEKECRDLQQQNAIQSSQIKQMHLKLNPERTNKGSQYDIQTESQKFVISTQCEEIIKKIDRSTQSMEPIEKNMQDTGMQSELPIAAIRNDRATQFEGPLPISRCTQVSAEVMVKGTQCEVKQIAQSTQCFNLTEDKSIQFDGSEQQMKQQQEELIQTKALLIDTQNQQVELKQQICSMQRELDIEKELNVSGIQVTKNFGFEDRSSLAEYNPPQQQTQAEDHTMMVNQLINLQISNEQLASTVDELRQELEERELNETKLIQKIRNLSAQLQEKERLSVSPLKILKT